MVRFILSLLLSVPLLSFGQKTNYNSTSDHNDTLKSFLISKQPLFLYSQHLNHKHASHWNKIKRGSVYVAGYDLAVGLLLLAVPENISKWDKKEKLSIVAELKQYSRSFTTAPETDKDLFAVNYLGHPYQGSFYYNSIRSQGATAIQSSLFSLAHSVLWEYLVEGGTEQPSIQDLMITPIAGSLLGEMTHVLTIKMSKNGFLWYEAVIVYLINPAYVLNNGIKVKRNRNTYYDVDFDF